METDKRDTPFGPTSAMVDGGDLDCGSGLLLMIRSAFEPVDPGGLLEIRSRESSVAEDLPAWCRMVGHELVGQEQAPLDYTYYFVRKKRDQSQDQELEDDIATAKDYSFRVRGRWIDGTQVKVFSRNHEISIGQPLSFNTDDALATALEHLLGSLAACLVMGFSLRLLRQGIEIHNLEIAVRAKIDNPMVFLGAEDEGHPGLCELGGKLYVDCSPELGAEQLQATFDQSLMRSPVAQSLLRNSPIEIQVQTV